MHVKQAGLVLALLWLTGCATTEQIPDCQEQARNQLQEPSQEQQEQEQEQPQQQENARELTATRMLAALERVATLDPSHAQKAAEALQARAVDLTAGDRFELALLLTQKGADDKSLKQAMLLLDGLEAEASEPSVREVLRLQRHRLRLEQLYRNERIRSAGLQKKIEYLKGLERELEESNTRAEEPLAPGPEHTQ